MAKCICIFLWFFINAVYSKTKFETLKDLVSKEGDILKLDLDRFTSFVVEQSISYTIIVLFTAEKNTIQCPACDLLLPIYEKIAYSYKISEQYNQADINEKKANTVFFSLLYYNRETVELFKELQFMNIPNIYVSKSGLTYDENHYIYDEEKMWRFTKAEDLDINKILEIINQHTGKQAKIHFALIEQIVYLMPIIGGILISLSLLIITIKIIINPSLWWFFSMVINFLCMGGIVFDVIYENALYGIDNTTGEKIFIATGPKSQFIIEGFLMSFIMIIGGISLINLNSSAKFKNPWQIRLVGIFSLIGLIGCMYCLVYIYRLKVAWYAPTFQPPKHYLKGSLYENQR